MMGGASDEAAYLSTTSSSESKPNESQGGDDDENDLPDHTQSMRNAARFCLSTLASIPSSSLTELMNIISNQESLIVVQRSKATMSSARQDAYNLFWEASSPVVPLIEEGEMSSREFRRRFHDLNLPCLIDMDHNNNRNPTKLCGGSDGEEWFSSVNRQWRRQSNRSRSRSSSSHSTKEGFVKYRVNRDWFVQTLGLEYNVPVRIQPPDSAQLLDDQGRATECETKQFTMAEWIQLLETDDDDGTGGRNQSYYLKDWHLQLHLPPDGPLYQCPTIFEFDLLNSFLIRFTKGDYRFCYWGPRGSRTLRHSDVLHSFSWSYNVVGTKMWTFFRTTDGGIGQREGSIQAKNDGGDSEQTITVIQRSGQAMFVPSQWQHEVVNLEETISFNHNWVTCANVDLCWECLATEIVAIDKELCAWGLNDNIEACESMLRGCVGLDVSAFFLMVLVRLCGLLVICVEQEQDPEHAQSNSGDRMIEMKRLLHMIRKLQLDEAIQLDRRLESVLQSKALCAELLNSTSMLTSR